MKEYEMTVCPIRKSREGFTMFCTDTCAWYLSDHEGCAVAILAKALQKENNHENERKA